MSFWEAFLGGGGGGGDAVCMYAIIFWSDKVVNYVLCWDINALNFVVPPVKHLKWLVQIAKLHKMPRETRK